TDQTQNSNCSQCITGRDELVKEAVHKSCQDNQTYLAILGADGMGRLLWLCIFSKMSKSRKNSKSLIQTTQLSISEGKTGY
ncbi:hypothetical protein GYMLUDRAFT_51543, partial [Collybiopsis luxurians FD-317 M1]